MTNVTVNEFGHVLQEGSTPCINQEVFDAAGAVAKFFEKLANDRQGLQDAADMGRGYTIHNASDVMYWAPQYDWGIIADYNHMVVQMALNWLVENKIVVYSKQYKSLVHSMVNYI